MATKTQNTAQVLYANRARDIAALMDWIGLELDTHAEHAQTDGIRYTHAGDLGTVREKMIETLAFLAQQDEKDIRDALDDAAAGREQAAGASA